MKTKRKVAFAAMLVAAMLLPSCSDGDDSDGTNATTETATSGAGSSTAENTGNSSNVGSATDSVGSVAASGQGMAAAESDATADTLFAGKTYILSKSDKTRTYDDGIVIQTLLFFSEERRIDKTTYNGKPLVLTYTQISYDDYDYVTYSLQSITLDGVEITEDQKQEISASSKTLKKLLKGSSDVLAGVDSAKIEFSADGKSLIMLGADCEYTVNTAKQTITVTSADSKHEYAYSENLQTLTSTSENTEKQKVTIMTYTLQ